MVEVNLRQHGGPSQVIATDRAVLQGRSATDAQSRDYANPFNAERALFDICESKHFRSGNARARKNGATIWIS